MRKFIYLMSLPFLLVGCGGSTPPVPPGPTPWYLDSDYLNSLKSEDVLKEEGTIQTIDIQGLTYKVRLIGVDHDNLADGSGKAHTTWEFFNLISDKNGDELTTFWNETSPAYDFRNSDLRKTIDGNGDGKVVWYEKGSDTPSTTYTTSVFEMLPDDFKGALKEVIKPFVLHVSGQTWIVDEESYKTKLFTLSIREISTEGDSGIMEEGTTYERYDDKSNSESDRVKKSINGDSKWYWVRSPNVTYNDGASSWAITHNGVTYPQSHNRKFSVAPAFCL